MNKISAPTESVAAALAARVQAMRAAGHDVRLCKADVGFENYAIDWNAHVAPGLSTETRADFVVLRDAHSFQIVTVSADFHNTMGVRSRFTCGADFDDRKAGAWFQAFADHCLEIYAERIASTQAGRARRGAAVDERELAEA